MTLASNMRVDACTEGTIHTHNEERHLGFLQTHTVSFSCQTDDVLVSTTHPVFLSHVKELGVVENQIIKDNVGYVSPNISKVCENPDGRRWVIGLFAMKCVLTARKMCLMRRKLRYPESTDKDEDCVDELLLTK